MPVNANFYYKTAKDASYVTLRNQNKMLYANYRIQQNNVQQGCQIRVALENGGVADADIIPKLLEGARETTAVEAQIDISSAACPVTIPVVIVDPYLSDKIYLALTTNAATYKAAALGSWITITSTEYAALKTSVSGTTNVGASDTVMGYSYTTNIAPKTFVSHRYYDIPYLIVTPTSSYFFALAFIYSVNNQTGNSVFVNSDSTSDTGFVKQGGDLPATVVASGNVTQYYVLKGQNTSTSATNTTSFALYDNNASGGLQFTNALPNFGVTNRGRYISNLVSPPTSSTTLTTDVKWTAGMQGIVASSVQWVTT